MDRGELTERLSAEVASASADGDGVRARKLSDLQLEVIAQVSRDTAAFRHGDALASVPLARPVPLQEQIGLLGDRHQLELLRWHWAAGYAITRDRAGWRAERRDDGTVLTEDTGERLRHLIREDFAARPVPRPSRRQERFYAPSSFAPSPAAGGQGHAGSSPLTCFQHAR